LVVQIGTPAEVFSAPKNTFVATLLGDPPMNLVDFDHAEVSGGTLRLVRRDDEVTVSGTSFSDMSTGPVKLGFRDFTVSLRTGEVKNSMKGSVYVYEPIEDNKVFTISFGDNRVKVLTPRSVEFALNDPVYVELDPASIHLFDGSSGERIGKRV